MVKDPDDRVLLKPAGAIGPRKCLNCDDNAAVFEQHLFLGMHVLETFRCPSCRGLSYYLCPVGHGFLSPVCFGENGEPLSAPLESRRFLANPLVQSLFALEPLPAPVEKTAEKSGREVILLNCLDNRFGHSFAKLWNATLLKAKYPECVLIVIVPANMKWLVPEAADETWAVQVPQHQMRKRLSGVAAAFQHACTRFEKVWLSRAYTHLAVEKVDFFALLKTPRFNLAQFERLPHTIVFALREDRLWHRNGLERFLFTAFLKMKWPVSFFVWRQNRLVSKTARLIRRSLPDARIMATGLGKRGKLGNDVDDRRAEHPASAPEKAWCALFSKTHLIIGVHGSNMLIPTALAAGFINIVPRDKIRHLAEDTLANHSARYVTFLGRHLDAYPSPRLVATHAVRLLKDFPYLYRNTEQRV